MAGTWVAAMGSGLVEDPAIPGGVLDVDLAKSVGIDMGLKDFLATSDGEYVATRLTITYLPMIYQ